MEGLPTPLSRVELYLAKAAGMDVTPPEPKSRLELFLAKIAGMDVEMPAPLSLKEMWLAYVAGSAPVEPLAIEGAFYIDNQKVDVRYLAVASGVIGATLPEKPQNRKEQYWAVIASGGPIVGVLKYVTGTNITLTDVVSGIEELQFVYGDTYQQTYSGANLYNYTDISATIGSGITTDSDGWITCTYDNSAGTSTHYSNYYTKPLALTPSTNYALVLEIRSVSGTGAFEGGGANTASQVDSFKIEFANMTAGNTIVVPIASKSDVTGANGLRSYFRFNAGQSGSVTLRISVLADTSITPQTFVYQPFTGNIPAPNPDYPQNIQTVTGTQTVKVTGKNILPNIGTSTIIGGNVNVTKNNDGSYTLNGTATVNANLTVGSIAFKEGQAYTISGVTGWSANTLQLYTFSSSAFPVGNRLNCSAGPKTVTALADETCEVRIYVYNGNTYNNVVIYPQVELGSTASAYGPYQGATYTINLGSIELCKIGTYQDYIYKSGGDWYVHRTVGKVTYYGNASENWVYNNSYSRVQIGLADNMRAYASNAYCTHLTAGNTATASSDNVFNIGGAALFMKATSVATSKDAWMAWLTTHNVSFYYTLATPTDTKITDATLVGQLNAIDSAVLPKPVAYITVGATDPNLPAPIKISYYGESE